MILTFEDKMSGVRVDLTEELQEEMSGQLGGFEYITPKDVPDFVLYGIWWSVRGMALQLLFIKGGTDVKIRKSQFHDTELLTDYYSKSVYDILIGSLSHNDQVKVWLYNNKPYVWNQLITKYKTAKKVFDNYIRFNH